jgi:hypothetical protein
VLIRLGTNAPDVSALKSEAANGPVGSLRAALLDKICDQIVWLRPAPVRSARLASRAFGALRAQHIGNTLDGNTWLADKYSEVAFLLQGYLPSLRKSSVAVAVDGSTNVAQAPYRILIHHTIRLRFDTTVSVPPKVQKLERKGRRRALIDLKLVDLEMRRTGTPKLGSRPRA